MTTKPKQHPSSPQAPTFWQAEATKAFADLCQSEGLNLVRFRRLIDIYVDTRRKPSRQELIDALKRRPRIQERAVILSSVTKKLNIFIETYS